MKTTDLVIMMETYMDPCIDFHGSVYSFILKA